MLAVARQDNKRLWSVFTTCRRNQSASDCLCALSWDHRSGQDGLSSLRQSTLLQSSPFVRGRCANKRSRYGRTEQKLANQTASMEAAGRHRSRASASTTKASKGSPSLHETRDSRFWIWPRALLVYVWRKARTAVIGSISPLRRQVSRSPPGRVAADSATQLRGA